MDKDADNFYHYEFKSNGYYKNINGFFEYRNQSTPPDNFFYEKLYSSDKIRGYIEYSSGPLIIGTGTFYDELGHGIVFSSFKNPALFVDTNINGSRLIWIDENISFKFFTGKMRNSIGDRPNKIYGSEISTTFHPLFSIGATGLQLDLPFNFSKKEKFYYSFFTKINHSMFEFNSEFGFSDQKEDRLLDKYKPFARYMTFSSSYKNHHFFISDAYYINYNIVEEFPDKMYFNFVPIGISIFNYKLMAKNYIQIPSKMKKYHGNSLQYSNYINENLILNVDYSKSNHDKLQHYKSYYVDLEKFDSFFYYYKIAYVEQYSENQSLKRSYKTFVQELEYLINDQVKIESKTEYQTGTDDNLLSQILSVSFDDKINTSVLYDYKESGSALGLKLKYLFNTSNYISFFYGKQNPQLFCANGFCNVIPGFDGVLLETYFLF